MKKEKLQEVVEILDDDTASSPMGGFKELKNTGLNISELASVQQFLCDLEVKGKVVQFESSVDTKELRGTTWSNALFRQIVYLQDGTRQLTYVKKSELARFKGSSPRTRHATRKHGRRC